VRPPLEQLSVAVSNLTEQWADTRRTWQDSVAIEFERDFWMPIEHDSREFLRSSLALDELCDRAEAAIRGARRDGAY
jgi:hypothetical protein